MFVGREFLCVPFLGAREPSPQGQRMGFKCPPGLPELTGSLPYPSLPVRGGGRGVPVPATAGRERGPLRWEPPPKEAVRRPEHLLPPEMATPTPQQAPCRAGDPF